MTLDTENKSSIEEEITTLVTELYDAATLYHESNDGYAAQQYIESYAKRVTRIGFRVAKENFTALRDSCVIFHDILNALNSRSEQISPEQFQQLEVWPTLILAYINQPDDKNNVQSILQLLQDSVWAYPINNEDFQQLQEDFAITNTNEVETTSSHADASSINKPVSEQAASEEDEEEEPANAFDGALLDSIQQEIIDAMSGLISDLNSTDPDDDFGLGHAFSLCADRIELLGMSIATAGLMGLMDVCMIFQTGLRHLAQREKPLSEDEQIIIEEWTSHLIAYLSYPSETEISDNLINYLNSIPWAEPLSEDEMMTLRMMLIPEDIEVTAPASNDEIEFDLDFLVPDKNQVNETDEFTFELDDINSAVNESISDDMYFLGQELIKLIHDEFQLEQPSLKEAIQNIQPNVKIVNEDSEELAKYQLLIERFALATDSIGLTGLNKTLGHLEKNLSQIITNESEISEDIVSYLKKYPDLSLDYLGNMDDEGLIKSLSQPLYLSSWPITFDDNESNLAKELLSPRLVIEDDIEIRATQATIDDVSLALPEDVNQQLLNTLLQELPVQTEEFTEAITQLVEGNASLKDVERAQRIAHTLKGAANTVGIVGIATLTHHIEDIFDAFTNLQRLPGKKLADILMNAADILEMMSEALLGLGEAPEQAQNVLQQILDFANIIDQEGVPEDDAEIQVSQNNVDNESTSTKDNDTSHLNEIAAPTMLRVPATLMDELLRIAGESIILGGQLQERLRKAHEQTQLVHEQNTLYQNLVLELEQIVDVQGLTAKKPDSKLNEVFDSLELEHYNELHTVTHRLVEAATDSKELTQNIEDELNTLDGLLIEQSRLHKDNQNTVMQTRMVPVQNIIPRLQRSIRQTSRSTNKKVDLNVVGSETLMDSDVLDELIDPIMHILRNAVDHGIENESGREKKGKNVNGKIELSFFRDGDHIVVRCADDGAGLDFDAIRQSAIKKEFITKEQDLSDEELMRLIWIAGFSTRDTTTQVSGRGIGMDAVYNQITAMKGTLNISSEKDLGCTVELRLPLTLISVHAILVKLRKQTIAISNRGIEQILSPGDGELKFENDKYTYHLNDDVYTVFDIETLLHQAHDQRNIDREERTVFIVRDETGHQYAVSVEHVIANQDLIVKQLGTYIPDIVGIEGATILGDGSIAPVLDLPGLIRTAANKDISPLIEQRLAEADDVENELIALVVDDSLSARRSLAEFVKDLGYDVRMARDGIEALEVIENVKPTIVLVDLEMPRMNGLEFTSHLRSKKETNDIPVIMITSRSTEKHRDMADEAGVNAYITKPFSEDQLLENIQNLLTVA